MESRASRAEKRVGKKKKSQETELQREKTPLRFLAGSGLGHDSKQPRENIAGRGWKSWAEVSAAVWC